MNIIIRPASAADIPAINALLSQLIQVHYAVRPDIFRSFYKNETAEFSEDINEPVFVAVDERKCVVGCIWFVIRRERSNMLKIDRDWLCIDDICVDKNYRGKGIGRRLVNFASEFAQKRGLPRIELNVYSDNHDAVCFYERLGFKPQKFLMELDVSHFNNASD